MDGQALVLFNMKTDHNHEVSEAEFKFAPKQRIVEKEVQKEIADMVSLDANKKIQKIYAEKTGKAILMKDIHNIATRFKHQKRGDNCTVSNTDPARVKGLADWIKKEFPALHTTFVQDEDGGLMGIFFQDSEMLSAFGRFPEVLLIDGTHKTNDQGMPLYTVINIDGNGESQVIAAFLVQSESEACLRSMTKTFKQQNPRWEDVKVILTDKDMVERGVFKSEMPQVNMEICLFHVLCTFGREITVEKMGVTLGEKTTILDKIQEIAYSTDETSYQSRYNSLCQVTPEIVKTYYDRNWHSIRYITSRSIEELIEGFMSVVSILRNERSYWLMKHLSTIPTKPVGETESVYQRYVTPYALTHIQEQIKYSAKVTVVNETTVETSTGPQIVGDDACTCTYFTHMKLPCRHMFAVKTFKGESLFMPEAVADRWTFAYYKSHRYINDKRPRLSINKISVVCQ